MSRTSDHKTWGCYVFAIVFAIFVLGLLSVSGMVVKHNSTCAAVCEGVYSGCEIWQDVRALLSFAFGIGYCQLFERNPRSSGYPRTTNDNDENEADKPQLSVFLI